MGIAYSFPASTGGSPLKRPESHRYHTGVTPQKVDIDVLGGPNPSSAVRGGTSRICRDLRLSDGRFLHYILQGIFNDATLLGQVQAQPLQQLGHHPFRPGYHAQAYLALSLGAFDG